VCPRDKYAGCYQTAAIDTHPPFEQPYITAHSRICIYASRIISQLSITSSRLFAGNNGSLLACCSLVPLFLLLSLFLAFSLSLSLSLSLASDFVHARPHFSRPFTNHDAICVSRDVIHIDGSMPHQLNDRMKLPMLLILFSAIALLLEINIIFY